MGQNIEYHNDQDKKQQENRNHVHYETCGKAQKYTKEDHSKETEDKCHTKYLTGGRSAHSGHDHHHSASSRHSHSSHHSKSAARHSSGRACPSGAGASKLGTSAPMSSLEQRMSHCYEIKRAGQRNECNRKTIWQHGKYIRDECGSGIVPKRFDLKLSRRIWCKTPLTMYQATIGELARQLLCREISVPRDVKGEPPSNIAEYIMPPCRGYYRKYDCLRPCEEEYAVVRQGKKEYRDRVRRYWEPCLSKDQKHKLDVNDYAPHNVFLGLKMRRRNNITDDVPCW